jgi:hypothetical protein
MSCLCQTVSAQEHTKITGVNKFLSADDLKHGEQQTELMVRDRPKLVEFVSKGDPIWNWVVRQFAGEGIGTRIYWNNSEQLSKPSEYLADNTFPTKYRSGFIRLKSQDELGHPICGEQLWAAAIFELNNIQSGAAFKKIYLDAVASGSKISKEDYITQNTMLEFQAMRKTALFYRNIVQPCARKKGEKAHDQYWSAHEPENYRAWIAQYTDHSAYPWNFWGTDYDTTIARARYHHLLRDQLRELVRQKFPTKVQSKAN